MTSSEALGLFESQVKRACSGLGIKVLRAPLALQEPGLCLRILPRKVQPLARTTHERETVQKALVLSLLLSGRIDSDTALRVYLQTCDRMLDIISTVSRLEDGTAQPIPNSRIVWSPGAEDAVFEDPSDDRLVWAREEWRVTIYIP